MLQNGAAQIRPKKPVYSLYTTIAALYAYELI
jgi:hypothetical protein